MAKKSEPSNFRKLLESICRSHDVYSVFRGFTRLSACAVACQTRESEYKTEAKSWKPDEMEVFAQGLAALVQEMETKPFEDVLGAYYMEFALSHRSQQWVGEFHTPRPVCQLMAKMNAPESWPEDKPLTVCEPACGAGAMILAFAEACAPALRRRLVVTAMDINEVACDMCFINTTLWHIPTRIFHGDTIRMEFWHGWSNFAWFMSPWKYRTEEPAQSAPPSPAEIEPIKQSLVQQELVL